MIGRRAAIAGMLATFASRPVLAAEVRLNGAAGLVCTSAGIAGLLFEGENGAALDSTLRWHVGSNTKAMTAALYGRLVDQGRCNWTAKVPQMFPGVRVHPAWTDVRIAEFLSHASGLTDDVVNAAWLDERHADRTPAVDQRHRFVELLLGAPPGGRRGQYRYGNANYVLIGAAMENATRLSWERLMQDELFATLRMGGAGFGAPPRDGLWGREPTENGPRPVDPAGIADNPAVLWPSGGVNLTPGDYATFMSMLLRGGEPLLRRETLQRLLTPATAEGRYAGGWSLAGPSSDPACELLHDGSNTLWFASARLDRAAGRGYAGLANQGGQMGQATTARLLRRVGGAGR